jgi:two-component sensor histidine kinase
MDADPPPPAPSVQRERLSWFARLPSGFKAFLILSLALLPLAAIGVYAVLQTTRASAESVRARLRVASVESGRRLAIELTGDASALASALDSLTLDPSDMPSCARVTGVFASQSAGGTRFAIRDRAGRLVCGTNVEAGGLRAAPGVPQVAVLPDRGLLLAVAGTDGAIGHVYFPTPFLEKISRPGSDLDELQLRLAADGGQLELRGLPAPGPLARLQSVTAPIGIDDLVLELTMPTRPITSPVLVAMLLPILMWLAAAGITWFAVDRLFIRPLRRLNASLATYTPGEVIRAPDGAGPQAGEIRAVYDSFVRLSRTVVDHEAELAEGLVRQTKLTREVHHRVKNNLQVIASLINFHSRGAITPEAAAAYAWPWCSAITLPRWR